jgi:hypothetical protein
MGRNRDNQQTGNLAKGAIGRKPTTTPEKPRQNKVLEVRLSSRVKDTIALLLPKMKVFWSFVAGAVAMAYKAYGFYGTIWPLDPDFSPLYPSASIPYDVPLKVENANLLFDVENIHVVCYIPGAIISRGAKITNISVTVTSLNQTIRRGGVATYTCPFTAVISLPEQTIRDASMQISYEYDRTFLFWRKHYSSKSPVFYLTTRTNPPIWTDNAPL